MASSLNIDSFVNKWQTREPQMAIAEFFCPHSQKALFRCWGAVLNELREACFELSDTRVTAVKVSWWAEEFLGISKGAYRHPLSNQLIAYAAPWKDLAHGLLAFVSQENRLSSDLSGVINQLQPLAQAVIACENALFHNHSNSADAAINLCLHWLATRLIAGLTQADRAYIPLNLFAKHGISFDQLVGGVDQRQALRRDLALQCLQASKRSHGAYLQIIRSECDFHRLTALSNGGSLRHRPWHTLWLAWRAARQCR